MSMSMHIMILSPFTRAVRRPDVYYQRGQTVHRRVNSAGDCCRYGDEDGYSRLTVKYNLIMDTMKNDSPSNFSCRTLRDDEEPKPEEPIVE